MLAIFKRELKSYFSSPIGYIFLAVVLGFGGFYFSIVLLNQANLISYVFSSLFTVITMIIPLITMRLLSEDKKNKTDQLLFTAPVSLGSIVMGKYLAAFSLYLISISSTVVYTLILGTFTDPKWNIFISNFLGLTLFGGALIAIGLFISSLTENQVIAAIGSIAVMLLIFMLDGIAQIIPIQLISTIFTKISFMARYQDFIDGILNVSHIIFFISVIAVFNFLAVRVLEKKRWS